MEITLVVIAWIVLIPVATFALIVIAALVYEFVSTRKEIARQCAAARLAEIIEAKAAFEAMSWVDQWKSIKFI